MRNFNSGPVLSERAIVDSLNEVLDARFENFADDFADILSVVEILASASTDAPEDVRYINGIIDRFAENIDIILDAGKRKIRKELERAASKFTLEFTKEGE